MASNGYVSAYTTLVAHGYVELVGVVHITTPAPTVSGTGHLFSTNFSFSMSVSGTGVIGIPLQMPVPTVYGTGHIGPSEATVSISFGVSGSGFVGSVGGTDSPLVMLAPSVSGTGAVLSANVLSASVSVSGQGTVGIIGSGSVQTSITAYGTGHWDIRGGGLLTIRFTVTASVIRGTVTTGAINQGIILPKFRVRGRGHTGLIGSAIISTLPFRVIGVVHMNLKGNGKDLDLNVSISSKGRVVIA